MLSREKVDTITKSIESTNNKAVLYFNPQEGCLSSSYFGLLVTFWERIVKEREGQMAFWFKKKDNIINELITAFHIEELFPCFDDLTDAINYVKVAEYNKKRMIRDVAINKSYA